MPFLSKETARNAPQPLPLWHVPSATPARRVLVVDPCGDTVESTAWLLRLWGHDVRGAGTGREALEVARAYRPDAVLMEIGLPGLDGCQVARRLRQQGADREVLLVAVTGYGDEKNRRRSQEAGFDRHLVKPVEPEVLQSLLATSHQGAGGRR
jgi:two-component system OmpR family response regulator